MAVQGTSGNTHGGVVIDGQIEAIAKLKDIEKNVKDAALKKAVDRISTMLVSEMKSRAPVGKEGALRYSIARREVKGRFLEGADYGQLVGPTRKARENVNGRIRAIGQFYKAWFLEFGTDAHLIKAKDKKLSLGGKFFDKVDHPGIATPRPFIGPAQNAVYPQLEQVFLSELDKYLAKVYGTG